LVRGGGLKGESLTCLVYLAQIHPELLISPHYTAKYILN
jgi:hypothetical protein